MNARKAVILGTMALVLAWRPSVGEQPRRARDAALRLADMGMGEYGPQLGGSQGDMILNNPGRLPPEPNMDLNDPGRLPREPDMILNDPGRLPPEPNMDLNDPGRLPREPNMDIEQPQDLDSSDDILR